MLAVVAAGLLSASTIFAAVGPVAAPQNTPPTSKALVITMIGLVNAHQLDRLGEVIAEDFVDHGPSAGGGLEGFRKGVDLMHSSFPDLHYGIEDLVAEGDMVTVRGTLSGTFSGSPLFGVQATGKSAQWLTLMTFRIAAGRLQERWTDADTWGMLERVGVLESHAWDSSPFRIEGAHNTRAEARNKAAARKLVETAWVKRDLAAVESFFAPGGGIVAGAPGSGELLTPAMIRMVGGWVFDAFPNFQASIDFVLAEGDKVSVRILESGTHTAPYAGVPASNRGVKWSDSFLFEFDGDGKITRAWLQPNQMGLMSQIGGFQPVPAASDRIAAAERNKAVFLRFMKEFWNERNFAVADELIDPKHFSSSIPTLPPGPEGMKIIAGVVAGQIFPDLTREVLQVFASEDMVGGVWINRGTHSGTYMNIPATGKHVEWIELGIIKMKDGKMVESWFRPDEVGLCKQLAPEKLEWLHF
jgi:predicted ester cyclase